MKAASPRSRANTVLVAGILFNLSISVLYSWSVIKSRLTAPMDEGGFGWTSAQAGLPYTAAIASFAVGMLVGGIIQDRIGPRKVATVSGLLVGAGLLLASLAGNSVAGVTVAFGVIAGAGIGAGYGCVSPCALKWFHPSKKGLVAGLVVGGYGLAAVYLAPLMQALLDAFGISQAFLMLGVPTALAAVVLAQFIRNPAPDYAPAKPSGANPPAETGTALNVEWRAMVRTRVFLVIFVLYALSSSVGLMVIGNISNIAVIQDPLGAAGYAALLVSLLALFNAVGRVAGGMLSDRIGRANALLTVFAAQLADMLLFACFNSFALLVLGALLVGFSYGTLLSVFPSLTADLFGLENYGTNYGIVYLGWGVAGVLAPVMADLVLDATGTFDGAYLICAGILFVCLVLGFVLRRMLAQGVAGHDDVAAAKVPPAAEAADPLP